ncbi:MAG: ABC transporter ATP-binding protein [Lachnospiraceae bacterium]|nr:ABC transporter ATP-binding protein [Lachnospiraceae bacterium]
MGELLHCEGITKHLGKYCIRDISLNVAPGEIVGVVGVNGCGKTSLLKLILGAYGLNPRTDDVAEITLAGKHFTRDQKEYRKKLAYVLADNPFERGLTAELVGELYGKYYDGYDKARYHELLSRYGVDAGRRLSKLSTGQVLRVQLAFAFSHDAELYVMDEPCASLDPDFRETFYEELRKIAATETKAVILSSHLVTELERIADRLLWMNKSEHEGTVRYFGDVDGLREQYRMVSRGVSDLAELPQEMIVGKRIRENSHEALVWIRDASAKEAFAGWLTPERESTVRYADLQEIMLFTEKGGEV